MQAISSGEIVFYIILAIQQDGPFTSLLDVRNYHKG